MLQLFLRRISHFLPLLYGHLVLDDHPPGQLRIWRPADGEQPLREREFRLDRVGFLDLLELDGDPFRFDRSTSEGILRLDGRSTVDDRLSADRSGSERCR